MAEHMRVVYALSLDGVNHRYVGATTTGARKRLIAHRYNARNWRGDAPVSNWMREVGIDNVLASQLERVEADSDIHEVERRWIADLRAQGFDLLNESDGGPGRSGNNPAEDVAKAAAARTGIKHKPHVFRDISKQVESGAKAAHNRWHVGRGIRKDACTFCST